MKCEQFEQIVGMRCNQLGDAVEVITPFTFADGDGIELFAESRGQQVYFYDDGFTLMHLHSSGLHVGTNKRKWQPLRNLAANYSVNLTDSGVFETLCPADNPSLGFARMVSTLLGVAQWEREHAGVALDASWLVEEVALYLQAWKPNAQLILKPQVRGFSGRTLTFDFAQDEVFIDAVLPHGLTTGAELRKLVDFNSSTARLNREAMVIVDDRANAEAAKQEMDILSRVAIAWPMSKLIAASAGSESRQ